ncbi:BEACH domain-containing protein B isoform X2 [Lactuca sativa]|uniref:BEACH domain-containing protein B isoform X2 n=1 Tax=Lactuca sativa TaxID=4236 RepID=UPI000CD979E8|nr:BEACH domain-containing protein B isoform X2 [Lactuca sativa]
MNIGGGRMNIVRGVAGLIRRTSGYGGDYSVGSASHKFPVPSPKVKFSDIGDEAILSALWERYQSVSEKAEIHKAFHIFLKQFFVIYKNWEPLDLDNSTEAALGVASGEESENPDEVIIGCSTAHPAEIIVILIEEVTNITAMVTECISGSSSNLVITPEGFRVLKCLTIMTRSMHNCKVLGYYGGIQKLTALMKAAVVQLKTIAGALSADETLSSSNVQKAGVLQKILVHVVSILCGFINLQLDIYGKAQIDVDNLEDSIEKMATTPEPFIDSRDPLSEKRLQWHQKAVISVMEAGGLNWLVELLRVIRRLSLKEQWTDSSLQYMTLRTLQLALTDNPRGQNHFRSIGGLEVLLDGLGVPSFNSLSSRNSSSSDHGSGDGNRLMWVLQLHVLSLEVLREAVFGNLNNLQFLCENGRVHKFANSFCLPAFVFQEFMQQRSNSSVEDDLKANIQSTGITESSSSVNKPSCQYWSNYTVNLSKTLYSFIIPLEDLRSHQVQSGRSTFPFSSVYGELSIKFMMRVLLTVFPSIKAFSNQNELPSHLRIFLYSLQHYVLFVFRKILVLSPSSLDVFRSEGVWDFIFSEHFYFGSGSKVIPEAYFNYSDDRPWSTEPFTRSRSTNNRVPSYETDILQTNVISVVEFAATLDATSHNMPECSVLLDALELFACNPEVTTGLAKCLLHILQLAPEKTFTSFKTLDAIPRVVKVTCIQAQESKKPESKRSSSQISKKSKSPENVRGWRDSMEACMQLFAEFFSVTEEAKFLVLNSSTCIDCLFDLFWEECLRSSMLSYIFALMKIIPSSEEDQKAKLYLCSKYLETFTHLKEREKNFAKLSIDLLVGMRDMLVKDRMYFQTLFRDGECFLHVVSLLHGYAEDDEGEKLVLNVLQTLTSLLTGNDASKTAFRALVGKGYRTLQSLLLDFCHRRPNAGLLTALLDMLVDGKFDLKKNPVMRNEDVILLYLSVLQKSSDSMRNEGLNMFLHLLRDSISNRASCVRVGTLSFLLDWFPCEDNDSVVLKIGQLIQVTGGHSVSGKEIRKIFALLRSERVGTRQQYCSLLLTNISSMLNEKGPTAFFNFDGNDSGIIINTSLQLPLYKGYSFSCWLRVESFPTNGTMGLFSFLSDSRRGCLAVLAKDRLIFESRYQKQQCVSFPLNLVGKKWHFLCLTHSIGRAFSGGSLVKCYLDGALVSSEKCSYPKVNEPLTGCMIGAPINLLSYEEDITSSSSKESSPFFGQIGPVYLFNDAITPEQVQGINFLGPNYMYSFLDNELTVSADNQLPSGVLDAKDGLASKIIFGLNAQASNRRALFNVSSLLDHAVDKSSFEATVKNGTQLCSRRLLQQIIYCAGGVSVFFPLFTRIDLYENDSQNLLTPITKERITAEIIELIASVLDENLSNQQQMLNLSGFSVLGFLLQSLPSQQLNMDTLSALKHMLNVISNCGLAEVLVEDAISHVFLNPFIWVYAAYNVQRELYMFLIQQFDNDPRLLKSLCRFPRVLDIIHQFYWDKMPSPIAGSKPLLQPITNKDFGERPNKEEIQKIRLLLLSIGEMSLKEHIAVSDIESLVSFFETSQDMACIEDILHMIIRALSQKSLLASFLEQVTVVGGCRLFVNLLQRGYEPIRLLGLQFLGRLLVGIPSEKKESKFFTLAMGRSKTLLEGPKRIELRLPPIFSAMSDRLFRFPQTDLLCATFFDVLLGGASPKQVIQRHNQPEKQRNKGTNVQFFLPQILVLIFKFLSNCEDANSRIKILEDLLELLDSNTSNIEALMENGWQAWLVASMKLDVLKTYKMKPQRDGDPELVEQNHVKTLFSLVLCHYIQSSKGGWQPLEETVNFLLMQYEHGGKSYWYLLRDIYEDLMKRLVDLSSRENILSSQPCRDNTLYLLKLVDELLISELDNKLPFPACGYDFSPEHIRLENDRDLVSALYEALQGDGHDHISKAHKQSVSNQIEKMDESWWNLYDNLWVVISEMHGKGPSRLLPKSSSSVGPSFGQRARGLVESLNIPAAEMAAVVVSGGLTNALSGKPNKVIDKAMLLRSEKCSRIAFRLMIVYLCKSSLERASRCVQQFIPILPCILSADDEQSKSRLQVFIWALLAVRSQFGMLDDGARFHVIAHLIREAVDCGKLMLATSIVGRDDLLDTSSVSKESGTIQNLIQKDRVRIAVSDEVKYLRNSRAEQTKQVAEFRVRMNEIISSDLNQWRAFEDDIRSSLNSILASDDSRRASFQLAHDEEQQVTAENWIHILRTLIDERGPWSANPFPNKIVTHWKLDKTEDRWRRRQKLRQNYHFNEKLCHPPSTVPTNGTIPAPLETKSGFAAHIPQQMKQFLLKGIRRITDESFLESVELDAEISEQKASTSEDVLERQNSEAPKEESEQQRDFHDRKDHSSTTTSSIESEVLMSVPCVLVTPKRKLAGRLAVMKKFLHFFGEFLVEGTGGSSVFRNIQASGGFDSNRSDNLAAQKQKFMKWPLNLDLTSEGEASDNINAVLGNLLQKQSENIKRHRRWEIGKIKAVHWTRYLLRYTAIEIYFNDSTAPIFFNFASNKEAKDVGSLIVSTKNESVSPKGYRDKSGVISFIDRRVSLELAETARESWRRRDITNFEYLMVLNTLSGRSYNDLTQYPVFPWVVADYSSDKLDFSKSSTFRDLSKPVGALDQKRFEVFEDRYRNFSDPDIPSFFYGSHYSSMGIVLYYLLRLEPFTGLHRTLQGGKFDHADRLFQSIESTFRNCLSNTSDVKELVPEFYYMSDFLVNSNSYHFGVKQDGEPLNDVGLPPWAKGSPEEFISINREALESEYVSSNLHHWIDLIFGYKQRGKPAVEAANIFYYLTYEGAADLETMDDELQRAAIEDQIANFGQTPIQIFRKKHPRRGPPIPIAHPLRFAPSSITLSSIVSSTSTHPSAVLYVGISESHVVLVNQGLSMSVKLWLTTQLASGGNFTFSSSQDPYFAIGADVVSPRRIGSPLAENIELGAQCFTTMQTPSGNFLVSCGNWENSFQLISLNDGRLVQSVRQHKDVVSCVYVTSDGSILATGSYDTTVMIWEVLRMRTRGIPSDTSHRKDHVIADTPFHILCGHDDVITCVYASTELDIVISGSKDGTCVFHTLRKGRYLRSLQHPSGCQVSKLVASRHGRILLYAEDDLSLHLYSINGKHLNSCESNGRLNCIELSGCGEFVVCGGDQGQIVVRLMRSLEIVGRYSGAGKIITCLTVTQEECVLAGTKDGSLLLYSIQNPQLRRTTVSRTLIKARPTTPTPTSGT